MKAELLNLNNVLTSLYQNIKIEEELFIKRKLFSKLYGNYCDSKLSIKKIPSFII